VARTAERFRETSETQIKVRIDLDGDGSSSIATTIPFFDHMLTLMAKHGFLSLAIEASGDTEVDLHHTVEDTGITLGETINEALGERAGIKRYGQATVPMDEALATVSIDLCSRPCLVYNVGSGAGQTSGFNVDLAAQFFRAIVNGMAATVHLNLHYGTNQHHILEALFKAFGRALSDAVGPEPRLEGVLSTKGTL
jgi:imidazoleglycerol-phosphate dehydratase